MSQHWWFCMLKWQQDGCTVNCIQVRRKGPIQVYSIYSKNWLFRKNSTSVVGYCLCHHSPASVACLTSWLIFGTILFALGWYKLAYCMFEVFAPFSIDKTVEVSHTKPYIFSFILSSLLLTPRAYTFRMVGMNLNDSHTWYKQYQIQPNGKPKTLW